MTNPYNPNDKDNLDREYRSNSDQTREDIEQQRLQKQRKNEQNELLRLEQEEKRLAKAQHQEKISRVIQTIYYLGGALMILLSLRFLLRILGANPDNIVASFILDLSAVFVNPFTDLFNNPQINETAVFEITTIVAIGVYALLVWLAVRLVRVLWN